MRLSEYTDYTLRVLMCCATQPDRLRTISEIAQTLRVSKNHLMKVVNDLAGQGLLQTSRGRGGGIRLMKPAREIGIGDVLRASERDFRLVECFDPDTDTCTLTPTCLLRGALRRALNAYFTELDALTLADIAMPLSDGGAGAGIGAGAGAASGAPAMAGISLPVSRRLLTRRAR
jgi:Rrf2 family nitric oxide-sensitive transcriptional repressor